MSVIGRFAAATDEEVASMVRDPQRIIAFLYDEGGASEPERRLDIDKSWHGMHFLLTGEVWTGTMPLGFLIAGGVTIGDINVGYGPARAFTSGDVRDIDAALRPISRADLMARWDVERIRAADLYAVDADDVETEDSYVGVYFEQVKRFVSELVRDGLGMLVYMT
jgi:hypothetical protein